MFDTGTRPPPFAVEGEMVVPWAEFHHQGLQWLINASVLNPRGYHLATYFPDDTYAVSTGFMIAGDGSAPWSMPADHPDVVRAFNLSRKVLGW